ncbi:MAG: succinate-semialdehyde dehydrogenase (NADP(+)), partial [Burkholderiales bacterium]
MRLKDPQLLRDKAYVNGEWVGADSGTTFEVTNPATGAVLARVPDMLEGETRRAIEAANAA